MKSNLKKHGVLAALCGVIAFAAQFLFGSRSHYMAANTATANYIYSVDNHKSQLQRTNDAAVATRNLLWKDGATAGQTVALCGAGDMPLGTIDNIESSTDIDQTVRLLGKNWTRKMVASEAISVGDLVYTAASGKVQGTPGSAGSYYYVGRALTASGADGDVLEVESCYPEKVVVIATLGNTNGEISGLTFSSTPTQAEAQALRDKCEELADDVRALAAALTSGGKVIVL